MNKILSSVVTLLALTACAEQYTGAYYNIQGSSSISVIDGKKLYLQVDNGQEPKDIDSCEVVHGEFGFTGKLDSVCIARLYTSDSAMPLVMEDGDISVTIDRTGFKVTGSPLNDLLYDYLDKLIQYNNVNSELEHKGLSMMLEGVDEQTIATMLTTERQALMSKVDSLETHFILDNLDNVLGPYAFRMLTVGYNYPVITPQLDEIMVKATDKFLNDPYVSWYNSTAKEIMARLRGEIDEESTEEPQP